MLERSQGDAGFLIRLARRQLCAVGVQGDAVGGGDHAAALAQPLQILVGAQGGLGARYPDLVGRSDAGDAVGAAGGQLRNLTTLQYADPVRQDVEPELHLIPVDIFEPRTSRKSSICNHPKITSIRSRSRSPLRP